MVDFNITQMKQLLWNMYVWVRNAIGKYLSDETYIKWVYRINNGEKLNLDNPQTFNEKLNWIKLFDRNPQYTRMADKYEAKEFVSNRLGTTDYTVPCLGVFNSFDEIDFDKLPDRFVLKTTFDSSGVFVVRDKSKFDKENAKNRIAKSMKSDYFIASREWPYKNIPHRLIVDQFLDNHTEHELTDYKFWCFNGEPKVVYVTNKGANICENFYDMNWDVLDINHGFPRHQPEFSKPEAFEEMRELARKISYGVPFLRVDFFYIEGKVWFGECTFFDWGGMRSFKSKEWDKKLGSWLTLPNVH